MTNLRVDIWRFLTLGLIGLALLITFSGIGAQDEVTRGVYASLAGRTTLYLAAALGIPLLVIPVAVRTRKVTPWIAGGITALALGLLFAMWWTGREGLGYQWTQSLYLVASPGTFGDLGLPLDWLVCVREGTDPYSGPSGGCAAPAMTYGPGLLWWSPFAFLAGNVRLVGVFGVLISLAALVWLSRKSAGRGQIAMLFAAITPGWLMLLNHGNLDQMIIWLAVLLVILVSRMGADRLLPWVLAAIPIWIFGTWKYYPFAMIIAFIPVLRIRRGWILIAGFLGAALAFLGLNWATVQASLGAHVDMGGGVGRSTLAAFIGGQASADQAIGWPDGLIALLLFSAAMWGWVSTRELSPERLYGLLSSSMLAISGVITVIGSVTIPGVGFPYKAALLLLAVPLLSMLGGRSHPVLWRSTTSFLILIVLGMAAEWNSLLSSLSVNIAAAFVLGLALRPLINSLRKTVPAAGN